LSSKTPTLHKYCIILTFDRTEFTADLIDRFLLEIKYLNTYVLEMCIKATAIEKFITSQLMPKNLCLPLTQTTILTTMV